LAGSEGPREVKVVDLARGSLMLVMGR